MSGHHTLVDEIQLKDVKKWLFFRVDDNYLGISKLTFTFFSNITHSTDNLQSSPG